MSTHATALAKLPLMAMWIENIQRKLEVAEVVSDQAGSFRTEFLEVIVVVLIFIEIILAFVHR